MCAEGTGIVSRVGQVSPSGVAGHGISSMGRINQAVRLLDIRMDGMALVGRNKRSALRRMGAAVKDGRQSSHDCVGLRCAIPTYVRYRGMDMRIWLEQAGMRSGASHGNSP